MKDYQIFEKIRPGLGGGLLTAVKLSLSPVLISPCNDEADILVVQCLANNTKIRVINGYGPQESEQLAKKLKFWSALEQEIISAKDEQCAILIQLDANAKVGNTVISGDPHVMSENGKLLLNLVERENMFIQNISPLCQGVITRQRTTNISEEKSILDYLITCEVLNGYLEKMIIDDARIFSLTKYASAKGKQKIVKSDHNLMVAYFNIQFQNTNVQKQRREVFNLKNKECQAMFSEVSQNNFKLRDCFKSDKTFPQQCDIFFKSLNGILHQCFRKVRVGKLKEKPEIQYLLDEKLKIQLALDSSSNENFQAEAQEKIYEIEEKISEMCAARNCEIVKELTKTLGAPNGNFSQLGMWKLKNQLVPKEIDPPMAKKDKLGNLITSPEALKNLYLETYVERLRHREMRSNLTSNYLQKIELWERRFDYLKKEVTKDWSEKELLSALKSLKNNKSRDPGGLINEIFKPPVIGRDLQDALLQFLNGIKRDYFFPKDILKSDITSIYKRKGSRLDMENDRGIFGLSVFKKIIDKIIYQEKYPLLDSNMSDSNVGARKKRNIKNHLFMIHGIINSIVNGKGGCVALQIYDLIKAFDALWVADCMNDLWDTLPPTARDDRLGLVFESSRTNLVAVNTAVGQTARVNIPEIAQQGGTWGPMMCSNSIDVVGKYAKENGQFYNYKNMVEVIPLAMVDDLMAVASCGMQSIEMNTSINALIELKKLTFHTPDGKKKSKCHVMHIGNQNKECPEMRVHGVAVESVSKAVYLGDILSSDGSNTANIKDRVSKGTGQMNTILNMMKTISFGKRYFQIAVALREAHLINGMLSSSDVWYGVRNKEYEELEEVDKTLLRNILGAPSSSCVESLYLELGLIPIPILFKARRIVYYHYLVNLKQEEMLFKFFEAQQKYPCKDDWTLQVTQDLKDFGIPEGFEFIRSKSINSFKRLVKIKAKEYTLQYLLNLKAKHTKMDDLAYTELKMQKYLKNEDIPVNEAQNLFRFRTRAAHFKGNYGDRYENKACPLCSVHMDTQSHSMQCPKVNEKIDIQGKYSDIFREKIPTNISKTLQKISKLRENYI